MTDKAGPGSTCAICLCPVEATEARRECPACHAGYHAECWEENGGCAIYGCPEVPKVEQRQAVEIPVSYWGQERKPCPGCGQEILAAAVRCRHCGASFGSARPQDSAEYQRRTAQELEQPAVRRTVVLLFAACALPCLAPLAAAWGLGWYRRQRAAVESLPPIYGALCKIGLVVALGQTALIVVMALLYAATRAP